MPWNAQYFSALAGIGLFVGEQVVEAEWRKLVALTLIGRPGPLVTLAVRERAGSEQYRQKPHRTGGGHGRNPYLTTTL